MSEHEMQQDAMPAATVTTPEHKVEMVVDEAVVASENMYAMVEEKAAPHEAGVPHLNTDTFASQIFWLVVTFAFLYIILSRGVLPRIHTVLENRQNKISHDIDRAEQLRSEAEEARESYERALKESRERANALLTESAALMAKSSAARHAEMDKKIEHHLADAENRISAAKTDAMDKLAPVAKEITEALVAKLTGKQFSAADINTAVDGLLKGKTHG